MRKRIRIVDERINAERNRVYRISFFILLTAVFVDVCVKRVLAPLDASALDKWMEFGIEAVLLAVMYFVSVFAFAMKGLIMVTGAMAPDHLPWSRVLSRSVLVSGIIGAFCVLLRIITRRTIDFTGHPWLSCLLAFLMLTLSVFIILLVTYLLAFLIAKHHNDLLVKNDGKEDEVK